MPHEQRLVDTVLRWFSKLTGKILALKRLAGGRHGDSEKTQIGNSKGIDFE